MNLDTYNKNIKKYRDLKDNNFFIILIFIILTYITLRNGSYFPVDKYISIILFSIFGFIFITYNHFKNKSIYIFNKKINFVILSLILIFIIEFFNTKYLRISIEEFILWIIGFLIIFIVFNIFNERNFKIFLNAFLYLGVLFSLIPYLAKFKIINNYGYVIGDRFSSTFQYPNTFSSFLMIPIFISLFEFHSNKKIFYSLLTSFFSTTLFLTQSKGSIITIIIVIIISFLINKDKYSLLFDEIFLILFVPIIFLFLSTKINFLLSISISLLIAIIYGYFSKKISNFLNSIISNIILLSLFFILFIFNESDIIKRIISLFNINTYLGLEGLSGRNSLIITSINIFKSHPLLGTGPGTFQFVYFKYRPTEIFSKFSHSAPFQFLSEFGIIGTILFLFFIYLILSKIYSLIKNKKSLYYIIILPYIGILLHTFIDFDLNIPASFYIFFILTGLIFSLNLKKEDRVLLNLKKISFYTSFFLFLIIFFNIILIASSYFYNIGQLLINESNYDSSLYYLNSSLILDSINSEKLFKVAEIYEKIAIEKKNYNYLLKANEYYLKATKYNPEYFLYHSSLGLNYFYLDKKQESFDELNKAIKLNPLDPNNYYNLGLIYEKSNMINDSINIYKKGLELDKNNKDIIKKLIILGDEETINKNVLIEVKSIIGGEIFKVGDEVNLEWEIYGNKNLIHHFSLKFSKDFGKTYEIIDSNISKSINSYKIKLPNVESDQCNFLLLVKDKNGKVLDFYKTPAFKIEK